MVGHPACHTGYSNPNGYACVTPLREREKKERETKRHHVNLLRSVEAGTGRLALPEPPFLRRRDTFEHCHAQNKFRRRNWSR